MNTVFVIEGSTGEYSDRQEWLVGWFSTEQEAREYTQKLCSLSMGITSVYGLEDYSSKYPNLKELKELDPAFTADYTGTSYRFWEIPKIVWKKAVEK